VELWTYNTRDRITSVIYVKVHTQQNINKWPKNENHACKVTGGIRDLYNPRVV